MYCAIVGSVPCACVLVSPLSYKPSVGDAGGEWGAQTKGVFAKKIIDVFSEASE